MKIDKTAGILVDIDGVVANPENRLHYLNGENKDWSSFFEEASNDTPLVLMGSALTALSEHAQIIYVTGRPESIRLKTLRWFAHKNRQCFPTPTWLMMRCDGDYRPAPILKQEILEVLQGYFDITLAIDDCPDVCRMYRANGIGTLEVAITKERLQIGERS